MTITLMSFRVYFMKKEVAKYTGVNFQRAENLDFGLKIRIKIFRCEFSRYFFNQKLLFYFDFQGVF